jgi:FixJ family two-component response regulator
MAEGNNLVAIIDDDEMLRDCLSHLLSAYGYQTETFASGEEFLKIEEASRARCLLVDVNLGDVSGVELVRQLSGNGRSFPIIYMTGTHDEIIKKQALELGYIAFLQKPFTESQLIEAVVEAIGNKFDHQ